MDNQKSILIPDTKIDAALQNRINLARIRQRGAKKKYQRMPYKPEKLPFSKRVVPWTP